MAQLERWWSVKLRVEDSELGPMSGVPDAALVDGVRHIRFGGSADDETDDPPSITFELQAPGADAAEDRAQTFAYWMRRAAKLPDALLPVVWIAPLAEDYASSRFLDQARDLIESEQPELAVVAAQIHFEVHLRALLDEAAGAGPARWAQRLLKDRGIAELKRGASLATVELLLGVDVTQLPQWHRFQAHVDRRNDVVHRGQTVERRQAEESVRIVQELWTRLTKAARD